MLPAPPGGVLRPNARALAQGLSFVQAFGNRPSPSFITRGAVVSSYQAGATTAMRGGVPGMATSGGWWGSTSANNTYSVNAARGTVLVAFLADHDSGSAGFRILLYLGNDAFPASAAIAISNFGGSWVAGWADGTDKRISVSATGLYSNGETVVAGLTWGPGGQTSYVKGRAVGTGAAATYASTAGSTFTVGNYANIYPWNTSGGIYYALSFDRELSPTEMAEAAADPWWWARQPARRRISDAPTDLSAEIAGTVDITASVAATLALDATIAGTVDVTASVAATTTLDAEIAGTVPITADISAQLDRLAEIAGTIPVTASITAFIEGGAGDTHDGFLRRSRRQRALEAAERRRDAERLADARALRLELEAALGMAADAVEEAPAPAVEAVREAVAVVRALPPVAPAIDFAAARAAVADLLAAIEAARRAKELADDDEDVEILLRAL